MTERITAVTDRQKERLWQRIDTTGPCWEWEGCRVVGYGKVYAGGRTWRVHRLVWELLVGPIPDGMVLDHLCHNRACSNPDHLQVTTQRENITRGGTLPAMWLRQTHCVNGHPLSGDNLGTGSDGERRCKTCHRDRQREYARRNRQRRAESRRAA